MSATVSRPALRALEPDPGRLGGVDAEAAPGAAVLGVLQRDRVARRTAAGEEVEHHARRRASSRGSAGSARSAWATRRRGRRSPSARRPRCRSSRSPRRARWCAASCGGPACSQSFWNTSTRSPLRPLTRRQTRSSGRSSISGRRPAPDRRPAVAEDRPDLLGARRTGAVAHPPRRRVAPDGEVQGPRGDRVELLVGVAQRQVPVAPAVAASVSGKSRSSTVSVLLASSTRAARVLGVDEEVLVAGREPLAELAALGVEVDHDLREEVGLAEHLVHQQPQVGDLVVVDADEDRAGRPSAAPAPPPAAAASSPPTPGAGCSARRRAGSRRGRRSRCRCCTAGRCRPGRPARGQPTAAPRGCRPR